MGTYRWPHGTGETIQAGGSLGRGENRVRWMRLAEPWGRRHLGDPPAPLPLEQGPEGLTSSPFSPGGPT